MNTNDLSDFGRALEMLMLALYLWGVVLAIRHLWRNRRDCLTCTSREAWLRSIMLAFLIAPCPAISIFPGAPAALNFALLLPGLALLEGHRLKLLMVMGIFLVLPWLISTVFIFCLWWLIRWWRVGRSRAYYERLLREERASYDKNHSA